jgi:hypothetical protein
MNDDIKIDTKDEQFKILVESLDRNSLNTSESIKFALKNVGAVDFKLVENGFNNYEVIRILKG